jgi:pimeloyl-ACP methyl ester carboxylesterase
MLHGWGGSKNSLLPLADTLYSRFTSYVLDLPGFGESGPPQPEWGIGEYARHVAAFIQACLPHPITVFGHSFGGALALYLAAEYPQYVRSIVVCAPSWHRRKIQHAHLKKQIFSWLRQIPMARMLFYRIFYPKSDILLMPHLESNFKKIITQDLTSTVMRITQPTYIIWGSQDQEVPVSDAHTLHSLVPNSRIEIVPNGSHGLPIRRPQHVARAIISAYDTYI